MGGGEAPYSESYGGDGLCLSYGENAEVSGEYLEFNGGDDIRPSGGGLWSPGNMEGGGGTKGGMP